MTDMAKWFYLDIYENQIKAEYDNSVLIQMPHASDYDGWGFWFPQKLVKRNRGHYSICYTSEFEFRLKKYSNGWPKKVLSEHTIGVEELLEAFKNNIDNFVRDEPPLIYTPEHKEPEGAVADESLIDD